MCSKFAKTSRSNWSSTRVFVHLLVKQWVVEGQKVFSAEVISPQDRLFSPIGDERRTRVTVLVLLETTQHNPLLRETGCKQAAKMTGGCTSIIEFVYAVADPTRLQISLHFDRPASGSTRVIWGNSRHATLYVQYISLTWFVRQSAGQRVHAKDRCCGRVSGKGSP